MGGTMEDTSTAASGKTCFSFLMSCLHMLSVTTANLHVLTPMWITARLTSLFLGMLASQWFTSSMARPETLRFWLWPPGNTRSGLMGRATEWPIRTLVTPGATRSSARRWRGEVAVTGLVLSAWPLVAAGLVSWGALLTLVWKRGKRDAYVIPKYTLCNGSKDES